MIEDNELEEIIEAVAEVVNQRTGSLKEGIRVLTARMDFLCEQCQKIPAGEKGEPGADGKSVTVAEVLPTLIEELNALVAKSSVEMQAQIAARLADIPAPRDGKDGRDGMDGKSVTVDDVLPILLEEIKKLEAAAMTEVQAEIQTRIAALPIPKDGTDGINGKDADPVDYEVIEAMLQEEVTKAVNALPKPLDGKDGKDAAIDYEFVDRAISNEVQKAIKAIPAPVDGKDGKDAVVDPQIIKQEVEKAVAALPPPKDGKDAEPIHPDTVRLMLIEEVQKAVSALPRAKDGEPGRDAHQIEPLASIDPTKSYPRGTYAHWNGGEIMAFRNTDPINEGELEKSGWTVSRNGIAAQSYEQDEADPRVIWAVSKQTNGTVVRSRFFMPVQLPKGTWKAEADYVEHDVVTHDGSQWLCLKTGTKVRPGVASAGEWLLTVKRGNHGRDGRDLGPPEPPKPVSLK